MKFVEMAEESGLSPSQMALLWVKDRPGITAPLIGARTVGQLEHLLPVLEMTATQDFYSKCDELVRPGTAVANFMNTSGWMLK